MKPLYGNDLLLQGVQTLARIEQNGMRVDEAYCRLAQRRLKRRCERLIRRAEETEAGQEWRKRFGEKTNFQSGPQMATVLFDILGHEPTERTPSGKPSTSRSALEQVNDPIVDLLKQAGKYQKASATYLGNFLSETFDGFMRPFFNLHTTRTYRSSSDSPNFQNIPVRDPEIRRWIRRAIVPRDGRRLVEVDFSGLEVRIAACYHNDPMMLKYIRDPKRDMHRDMASECYLVPTSEVSKDMRFWGKSGFVFPAFYGSYYAQIAPSLWKAVHEAELKTTSGDLVKDVLKRAGITRLGACSRKQPPAQGTFEHHIKKVENQFWRKRFRVYGKWRKTWYEEYCKRGYFDTLTGFRCSGIMKRNDVINYPVQGSAFHCLLYALILLDEQIRAEGKETLIVGQIHDSIVSDVPDSEMTWFVETVRQIMEKQILALWDWIIVPLEVEIEATPINESWYEKMPYESL